MGDKSSGSKNPSGWRTLARFEGELWRDVDSGFSTGLKNASRGMSVLRDATGGEGSGIRHIGRGRGTTRCGFGRRDGPGLLAEWVRLMMVPPTLFLSRTLCPTSLPTLIGSSTLRLLPGVVTRWVRACITSPSDVVRLFTLGGSGVFGESRDMIPAIDPIDVPFLCLGICSLG